MLDLRKSNAGMDREAWTERGPRAACSGTGEKAHLERWVVRRGSDRAGSGGRGGGRSVPGTRPFRKVANLATE